jgi:3-ketoacyl-CoA synthase
MAAVTHSVVARLKALLAGKRSVDLADTPVYMLGFHVYRPPAEWRIEEEDVEPLNQEFHRVLDAKTSEFFNKILARAGLNRTGTYFPPGIMEDARAGRPYKATMQLARAEAEDALFSCVQNALDEAGLQPRDVGVLVVNCSLFNPTPSLSAMVVNHFKLPSDIITYNLGGMGCSAGLLSLTLVQDLLQAHSNKRALIVSMENITQNFYNGLQRGMLIPNAIFRVGCAAILLSNRAADAPRAKYELLHTVRTHMGASDEAYKCVFQQQDEQGHMGVQLDKTLMKVAGNALRKNIETLGILALPLGEQIKYLRDAAARKRSRTYAEKHPEPYIPDFKKAVDHFCIHAGGRGVIDAIQASLGLSDEQARPSRQALAHYGNTSSSSIWYEFAWSEHHGRIKPGDKVWQIGFGSGFKCNSAVWVARRKCGGQHTAWMSEEPKAPQSLRTRTFKGSLADAPANLGEEVMGQTGEDTLKRSFMDAPTRRWGADAEASLPRSAKRKKKTN